MRATLLSWLPDDLSGQRILDAGCGPGVFSLELAARGAHVVGVDLSESLIETARERARGVPGPTPEYIAGDLIEVARSMEFDRTVVMDCFIHYPFGQTLEALRILSDRTREQVLFTVAPWTPLLAGMHTVGRLFPKRDKAPPIVPVRDRVLRDGLTGPWGPKGWSLGRTDRVNSGFYISRGAELRPAGRLR
jgi:magnesium-protoporphyrin O-methyltransferase